MKAQGLSHHALRDERGVALMLVLWVIVVLGAIAAGVATVARGETRLVETIRARTVARYAAESGVVAALQLFHDMFDAAEDAEARAKVFARFQAELHRAGPQLIGNARYQVAVEDLGSRVDLNNADEQVILGLFLQFFDSDQATALSHALQDWIDAGDEKLPYGAEAGDYARLASPFRPTNQPIQRLDELTRIAGFSDSVTTVLAPFITVRGDGRINVNTAPLPVLAALPEIGPEAADYLLAARAEGETMTNNAMIYQQIVERSGGTIVPRLLDIGTTPTHILIVSRGWEDGQPLTHEVQTVFALEGLLLPNGGPARIVSWSERDR